MRLFVLRDIEMMTTKEKATLSLLENVSQPDPIYDGCVFHLVFRNIQSNDNDDASKL